MLIDRGGGGPEAEWKRREDGILRGRLDSTNRGRDGLLPSRGVWRLWFEGENHRLLDCGHVIGQIRSSGEP